MALVGMSRKPKPWGLEKGGGGDGGGVSGPQKLSPLFSPISTPHPSPGNNIVRNKMFCLSFCGRKGQMDRESPESSKTQQGIRGKVEVRPSGVYGPLWEGVKERRLGGRGN